MSWRRPSCFINYIDVHKSTFPARVKYDTNNLECWFKPTNKTLRVPYNIIGVNRDHNGYSYKLISGLICCKYEYL